MKRRTILLILYAVVFMFIGRNLPLPSFTNSSQQVKGVNTTRLQNIVEAFLKGQKDTFSIYFKDLKTGSTFGIDENKVLTGASLNKLFIVGYLYHLASQSKTNLDDTVIIQEEDIQNYGTGSIQYQEPGVAYSVRKLAQLSLEQSDNTAAHVLGVRLGTDKIQSYVDSLGLTATDMENNKTTASDVSLFLEDLYTNKIADAKLTRELLDFMKDTDFEDRISRNIADKTTIYHKTGDATRMIHDAGIVEDNGRPFILSVLSSDVTNEETAKETIGKIAQLIYEQRN